MDTWTTTQKDLAARVEDLMQRMRTFPDALDAARRKLSEETAAHDDLEGQLEELKAEHFALISGETDGSGKPRFSNEATRKAELTRRLSADPTYKGVDTLYQQTASAKRNAALDFSKTQDDHRASNEVSELTLGLIRLLTAGM